jgi:2-haloacid dehalogenase
MRRLGAPAGEEHGLADSLPGWRAFPEVQSALEEVRRRGWKLAILSNTDDDFIAASQVQIGVPFEEIVVAQEIGSYKPGHRHWNEFFLRTRAPREGYVHVAASLFHDVAPCYELGYRSVWINRLGERNFGASPTRALTDLFALPETLDELVPTAERSPRWRSGPSTSATPAGVSSTPASCVCHGPGATVARGWPRRRA